MATAGFESNAACSLCTEPQRELLSSAASHAFGILALADPKSAGALAMAEKPQRAASLAASISFAVREQRAAAQEWLRNHDRALSVADAQVGRARGPCPWKLWPKPCVERTTYFILS